MKLAEPVIDYRYDNQVPQQWVEVLVDCVYAEGLYTYQNKPDILIKAGDIVSVPFGNTIVGGVVVRILSQQPDNLDSSQIKEIDDIVSSGFFSFSLLGIVRAHCQLLFNGFNQCNSGCFTSKTFGAIAASG